MSGLSQQLATLRVPSAYPHPTTSIEFIETHISWVFLTGEFAYKIKRPVQYPFVDQRSLERREFLCREEVRLNRRFAPQIYLGVCAITSRDGLARIGGSGRAIEHAVKMRQFRREDELDRLLAAGGAQPGELEVFGRDIARIHARLPSAGPEHPWGRPAAIRTLIETNVEECARAARIFGQEADVRAVHEPLRRRLESVDNLMQERFVNGRIRECHGDLHTRNAVRTHSGLVAFDCLEFEPALRWIDVADEVAFLLADLESQGRPFHAHAFLGGYLAESGDYCACQLLDIYEIHRALVRAKITALVAAERSDSSATESACRQHVSYLECAAGHLGAKRPRLILMSGLSGSGKTWLAARLAPLFGAVHLRSDRERKRLAGLDEVAHSESEIAQGLYSTKASQAVYEHLLRCASEVLGGGYTALVDATFQRRGDRLSFRDLASRLGVPIYIVHCNAPRSILESRLAARERRRDDASEADLSVLQWQVTHFEPILSDEGIPVVEATTSDADVMSKLVRRIDALSSWPTSV